jgi:hypothetical protein
MTLELSSISNECRWDMFRSCIKHREYAAARTVLLHVTVDESDDNQTNWDDEDYFDLFSNVVVNFDHDDAIPLAITMLHHVPFDMCRVEDYIDSMVAPHIRLEKHVRDYGRVPRAKTLFPPEFAAEFIRLGGEPAYMTDPDAELYHALFLLDQLMYFDTEYYNLETPITIRVKHVLDKYPRHNFPYFRLGAIPSGSQDELCRVLNMLQQCNVFQGRPWCDKTFSMLLDPMSYTNGQSPTEQTKKDAARSMIDYMTSQGHVFRAYADAFARIHWAAATDDVVLFQSVSLQQWEAGINENVTLADRVSKAMDIAIHYDAYHIINDIVNFVWRYNKTAQKELRLCAFVLDRAIEKKNVDLAVQLAEYIDYDEVCQILGMYNDIYDQDDENDNGDQDDENDNGDQDDGNDNGDNDNDPYNNQHDDTSDKHECDKHELFLDKLDLLYPAAQPPSPLRDNYFDCCYSLICAQIAHRVNPDEIPAKLSDRWFRVNENVAYAISQKWHVPREHLGRYRTTLDLVRRYVVDGPVNTIVEYV